MRKALAKLTDLVYRWFVDCLYLACVYAARGLQ